MSRPIIPILTMLLISGIIISIVSSCHHETDNADLLPEICFEREILSIFQTSCAMSGCHNSAGEAGFNLTTYNGIMKGVIPGEAMKSKVYSVLVNVWSVENMMPPDRPLSMENRSLIKIWIEQGAKENACP
jgi:hypothetical protein